MNTRARKILHTVSTSRSPLDLPPEVIQEILSRLPISSLFQTRYVSRKWRLLINEPLLSHLHYTQSCRQIHPTTSLILLSNYELFYISNFNTLKKPIKLTNLPFKSWLPRFKVVGSCNGLICLADDLCIYRSIFICNPVIGEWFLVPENEALIGRVQGTNFGFGYDSKKMVYKVVRVRCVVEESNEKYYELEVLTLGTKTWRNAGKVKGIIGQSSNGVLVNESLHWLGIGYGSNEVAVIILDLADERLHNIVPVAMECMGRKIDSSYHLGELGGCLVIIDDGLSGYVNVFVMKEYGNWGSWSTKLSFKVPAMFSSSVTVHLKPLVVQENDDIVVEIGNRALFIYNLSKRRTYRMIKIKGLPRIFGAVPHVGTFVPLKHIIEDTTEKE